MLYKTNRIMILEKAEKVTLHFSTIYLILWTENWELKKLVPHLQQFCIDHLCIEKANNVFMF